MKHTPLAALAVSAILGSGLASADVIADFSAEFPTSTLGAGQPFEGTEEPAVGWDYMWNPDGVIGIAGNYQPLTPNTIATWPGYGGISPMFTNVGDVAFNAGGQGNFQYGRIAVTSIHPAAYVGGSGDYRAIIAYTIQEGEEGPVNIANSSLAKIATGGNGVDLDIYVNDTLIEALSKDGFNSSEAENFDGSLGTLSVGDTVFITIGTNGVDNGNLDASVIDFQLVPGTAGYGSWAATNEVLEGENGDDDKDGILNLVEYALGLDPQAGNPAPGTFTGNTLTFTKGADAKAALDVTYKIQTSTTLEAGSWTDAAATETTDDISFLLPASEPGGKLFGRLQVTKP